MTDCGQIEETVP